MIKMSRVSGYRRVVRAGGKPEQYVWLAEQIANIASWLLSKKPGASPDDYARLVEGEVIRIWCEVAALAPEHGSIFFDRAPLEELVFAAGSKIDIHALLSFIDVMFGRSLVFETDQKMGSDEYLTIKEALQRLRHAP